MANTGNISPELRFFIFTGSPTENLGEQAPKGNLNLKNINIQ